MKFPNRYVHRAGSAGGGMGDIFFCTDSHLDRSVVVKMIKSGGEGRRLLDEQLALTKIRSKHVVQLYDIIDVEKDGQLEKALVLEYIEGHDLKIESFAPDLNYLKVLWQIACGLAEIHKEKIIHRDIKPQNIRKDAGGIVKILDFGLARSQGVDAKTRNIIGTVGYMAPELWSTSDISFDQEIDVYAFGVMALTLISTDVPPPLTERPPKPIKKNTLLGWRAGIPDDVWLLIERCVSHNPTARPSMAEVEFALRRHLLVNQHRALVVLGTNKHEINSDAPRATLKSGDLGTIGISYDGIRFNVFSISGDVAVNNTILSVGDELPACCVIAFGPVGSRSRVYATFDVSNPEVMP